MNEIRDEQLSEAIGHKEVMEELENSPGWKLIVSNLEIQIQERTNKLDGPIADSGEVYRHEYMKGARQMARFTIALPKAISDSSRIVIEAITAEQEEIEDGEETRED